MKRLKSKYFQSLLKIQVISLKYNIKVNLGMPGGASLYSLSVAWVSSSDPLTPKAWRPTLGFVLVAVVAGVANPNRIWAITKRVLLFTRPFSCLKGSMLYKAFYVLYIMDPFK